MGSHHFHGLSDSSISAPHFPVCDNLTGLIQSHGRTDVEYRGDRFTEGLEATGDSISKAAGRAGKAVGGFFKGLFEQ